MNKFVFVMVFYMSLGRGEMTLDTVEKYKLHTTPATFEEAKKICKAEGGSLAVVTSKADEQEMLKLWSRAGPIINPSGGLDQQAFIGMHSLLAEGQWVTVDGYSAPYVNWSPNWVEGQQPCCPRRQKCGSLLKQGGMDDVECHHKLAFFCENIIY